MMDETQTTPLIKCACGCGEKLFMFDACGRPRRYINGHFRRPNPRQSSILVTLKGAGRAMSRKEIAEIVMRTRSNTSMGLTRLQRRDKVENVGFGLWKAKA